MATSQPQSGPNLDRYVVIHVATTCDQHAVYVARDCAEVIEMGWILLDAKTCEEVRLLLSTTQSFLLPLTVRSSPDCTRQRLGQARQHAYNSALQYVDADPSAYTCSDARYSKPHHPHLGTR